MVEPLDPKKFHVLTGLQKIYLSLGFAFLFLVIFPLLAYVYYDFALHRPAQTDIETTFEIKKGQGLIEVSHDLYEKGLVNSEFLFRLYGQLSRNDKNIQAGVYRIKAGASVVDLYDLFKHGTNDVRITFLEGWRAEEISRETSQRFNNIDYEAFLKSAKPLEGTLFPDTYFFNSDIETQDLISTLTNNFETKTKSIMTAQKLQSVGLSQQEALILASLVEREVPNHSDRKKVAGILLKRLKDGEKLGVDATVQYVIAPVRVGCALTVQQDKICPSGGLALEMNWWPKELTFDDLNIDSPYNTRKYVGLPPQAISNPGLDAIEAVLNPEYTGYNYYLHDKDGNIHYAKTLVEHNKNIQLYIE